MFLLRVSYKICSPTTKWKSGAPVGAGSKSSFPIGNHHNHGWLGDPVPKELRPISWYILGSASAVQEKLALIKHAMTLPAKGWDNHHHTAPLDTTGHTQVTLTFPMTPAQALVGAKGNKKNVDLFLPTWLCCYPGWKMAGVREWRQSGEAGRDPACQRVGSGCSELPPWSPGGGGGVAVAVVCGFRLRVLVLYAPSHWTLSQKDILKEKLIKDFKTVNVEHKTPSAGPFWNSSPVPLYWSHVREAGPAPVTEWGTNTHLCPGPWTQDGGGNTVRGNFRRKFLERVESEARWYGVRSGSEGTGSGMDGQDLSHPRTPWDRTWGPAGTRWDSVHHL